MKVIFLDIDGVLQPEYSQKRFEIDRKAEQKKMAEKLNDENILKLNEYDFAAAYVDWHKEAVENLRQLILETNSVIVIVSNWKAFYKDVNMMKLFFKLYNLDQYVIANTVDLQTRYLEIQKYLEEHPEVENFVIIDDAYEYDYKKHFPDNYVTCNHGYFKKEEYLKALEILNRK